LDEAAKVVWSKRSFAQFQQLPDQLRERINNRLPLLQQNPQMYQLETAGKWEGLRRMVVGWYKLYYTYWHSEHTIYVETIVSTRHSDR